MKKIIEIKNLYKSFGDVKAVLDLSFCVKEGELFAFLGVNGAGKSTTINIICGQLAKDSGTVIIDENILESDVAGTKTKLGVVFQNSVLDQALSVKENLRSRAALYGITGEDFRKRLEELDMTSAKKQGKVQYFVSDITESFARQGGMFLNREITEDVKRIDIENY